jgi:hypothetical protein
MVFVVVNLGYLQWLTNQHDVSKSRNAAIRLQSPLSLLKKVRFGTTDRASTARLPWQHERQQERQQQQQQQRYENVNGNQQQLDANKRIERDNNAQESESLLQTLQDAGIDTDSLSQAQLDSVPTMETIRELYGPGPVVYGLDQVCQRYQESIPPMKRMLGSAGMFSSGTNLVTRLLKANCYIPERRDYYGFNASKEAHGMRWQV